MPDPPVAVRAEGSTIWDADGRAYLDAAGGAIVVNVGHGRREIAAAMAEQAGRARLRPRQRVHDGAARALRRGGRPPPADRRPGDLPGLGRVGGHRDRPQARPRLPPRPRRDRTAGSSSRGGGATTATRSARSTCRAASRSADRTRAGSAGSGTSRPPIRTGRAMPGANALGDGRRAGRGAGRGAFEAAGPGHGRRVRRGADRRRDARRGRPAGRLLAGDRRGLPPPRRPAHRRRGDDRVRAHGSLVRAGPLGGPAGPARRREGRDLGLLAVRVRGGLGRGPRRGDRRPPASSTDSPTPTGRWPPRSPTRSSGSSRTRISSRPAPPRASGSCRLLASRDRRAIRTSARSAAAACWSGWNSWRTGSRARRTRARRASTEAVVRPPANGASCVYSGTGNADGTNGDTILLGPPFIVTDDEFGRIVEVVAAVSRPRVAALETVATVSDGG